MSLELLIFRRERFGCKVSLASKSAPSVFGEKRRAFEMRWNNLPRKIVFDSGHVSRFDVFIVVMMEFVFYSDAT